MATERPFRPSAEKPGVRLAGDRDKHDTGMGKPAALGLAGRVRQLNPDGRYSNQSFPNPIHHSLGDLI